LPVSQEGAQRASRQRSPRSLRFLALTILAATLAVGGLASHPGTAAAAGKKVVIVVGPAGSNTADYIYNAKKLAAQKWPSSWIMIITPIRTSSHRTFSPKRSI